MSLPPPDRGVRLDWEDMPEHIHEEVVRWLGGRVVNAQTQPTGFSPGVATRLTADNGRHVFLKAVGPDLNPQSSAMHRQEINVVTAMPGVASVPQLLWSYDEGEDGWVVLAYEDVEGRHPTQPWRSDELDRIVSAIEDLCTVLSPSPLPADLVGTAADRFAKDFQGWKRLLNDNRSRLKCLDEWSLRNIETLIAIEETAPLAVSGDTLLHFDIRADNILLTTEQVWFVDWPHACIGPSWLDIVAFAPSVTMQGGPPPEVVTSKHFAYRTAGSDDITAAVVAIAGYFTRQSLMPPPSGLPTVRAFQRAQGEVARRWVSQRTGLV